MEYRKNDIVTLKIEDCGIDGEGIGKADGFTVFVKDAVIGDTVRAKIMKAKKNYGYGRLEEIITPSPDRVEPKCQFARQCGGCQLQALSYEKQLEFKTSKVRGHLERIGGFTDIPMEKILGMDQPFHYRNKAQFPVGKSKDGRIITGFYAGRTHSIIENRDCALGVTRNKEVLDRVIAHMEKFHIQPYDENTGKGLVRHVLIRYGFFTDEMMVCLIINGEKLPGEEAQKFSQLLHKHRMIIIFFFQELFKNQYLAAKCLRIQTFQHFLYVYMIQGKAFLAITKFRMITVLASILSKNHFSVSGAFPLIEKIFIPESDQSQTFFTFFSQNSGRIDRIIFHGKQPI